MDKDLITLKQAVKISRMGYVGLNSDIQIHYNDPHITVFLNSNRYTDYPLDRKEFKSYSPTFADDKGLWLDVYLITQSRALDYFLLTKKIKTSIYYEMGSWAWRFNRGEQEFWSGGYDTPQLAREDAIEFIFESLK